MNQWKIKLHTKLEFKNQIIRNKIIIDYALEYSSTNKINKVEVIKIINLVRLYKKLYLLVELVAWEEIARLNIMILKLRV